MRASIPVVLAIVCLPACNGSNKNPTPPGAKVLAWELSDTDRATMKTAQLSNRAAKDLDYTDADTGVALKLHVATATATFQEDGTTVVHDAIVAITATVQDGNDFTLVDRGCAGPNYQLAAPGAAPRAMLLDCMIKATKPRWDGLVTFQLRGDGTLVPSGKKTEIFKSN